MNMKSLCLLLLVTFSLASPSVAQELAQVPALHTSAVGYGASQSDIHKSFAAVVARGEAGRDELERCLTSGTPAAKLYGAIGLYKLDPKDGRAALRRLLNDKSEVLFLQGCLGNRLTVKALATDLLSQKPKYVSFGAF